MAISANLKQYLIGIQVFLLSTFLSFNAQAVSTLEFEFSSDHGKFLIGHEVNTYNVYEQIVGDIKLTVVPKSTTNPHLEHCHDFDQPHEITVHQSLSGLGVKYYNKHFWQPPFLDSGLLDSYSGYTDRLEFSLTNANTGEPVIGTIKAIKFKRFDPILFLDNAIIHSPNQTEAIIVDKTNIDKNLHLELFPTSFLEEHTLGNWRFDTHIETNQFTITPGAFDAFKVYGITINVANSENLGPDIISEPSVEAQEGIAYGYAVETKEASDDYIYGLTESPTGMLIESSTGVVDWTPNYDQSGSHNVTISVVDSQGRDDTQSYIINVLNSNRAPTLTSTPVTLAKENAVYEYQVEATDPDGDSLNYQLIQAPSGMEMSETGLVSWQPSFEQAGEYEVLIQISDGELNIGQTYSLVIENTNRAPSITSHSTGQVAENQAFSHQIQAQDQDGQTLHYSLENAPFGMTVDTNGVINWQPNYEQSGQYLFNIIVSDGEAQIQQAFTLIVDNTNRPPVITSTPVLQAVEGQWYEYALAVSDLDGDALSYRLLDAPDGMSISEAGLIKWQPDFAQGGEHRIEIDVQDLVDSVRQAYTLTVENVNRSPNITPISTQSATENQAFAYQLLASDPDQDSLTYELIDFPSGFQIDQSGLMTWTPTFKQSGKHAVNVQVSDAELTEQASFEIHVNDVNRSPEISPIQSQAVAENESFSFQITASDPDGDELQYQLIQGPSTMLVDETGHISWTPSYSESGSYDIIVSASDGQLTAEHAFVLSVTNVNRTPQFTSVPSTQIPEKQNYYYAAKAEDPDGDVLTYQLQMGPAGMSISPLTGEVSWVTSAVDIGSHYVVISATDSSSAQTEQSFTLFVDNVNDAPVFTSTPVLQVNEGESYVYSVQATDEDGDSFTFELLNHPDGMTISQGGVIQWLPQSTQVGVHSISVRAKDTNNGVAVQNFELTVIKINHSPVVTSNPYLATTVNSLYQYPLSVKDNEGDEISYAAVILPDFLTLSSSGFIAGTPVEGHVGTYPIEIEISDGTNTISHEYSLNVLPEPNVNLPNWGRDFWFVDAHYSSDDKSTLRVFITSKNDTQGTIQSPTGGIHDFNVAANEVLEIDQWSRNSYLKHHDISERGIHITAEDDISVYVLNYTPHDTDAMVIMPTDKLGTDYRLTGYMAADWSIGEYAILATEDNTEVFIRPTQSIELDSWEMTDIGDYISVTLNKGQVYSLHSAGQLSNDLTGSEVNANKPVSVFTVSSCQNIPIDDQYCDQIIEQIPATHQWGNEHALIPLYGRYGDIVRVLAKDDNTRIRINGVESRILNADEFWEYELNTTQLLTSNYPILISQFSTSDTYDIEKRELDDNHFLTRWRKYYGQVQSQILDEKDSYQTQYTVDINASDTTNSVVLVVHDDYRDQITLNGQPLPESYFPNEYCGSSCTYAPYNLSYAIGQIALEEGTHTFESSQPFGLYEDIHSLWKVSDPFMLLVPPLDLANSHYVISTPINKYARHFVNVVIPVNAVASFSIDGKQSYATFFREMENTGFAYARLAINEGKHTISADQDFSLTVYGYDSHDSYGFIGGYGYSNFSLNTRLQVNVNNDRPAVGDEVCVTSQLIDEFTQPVSDAAVNFVVAGANPQRSRAFTDKNGLVDFCFTGNTSGQDVLTVEAGNQSQSKNVGWSAAANNVAPVITSAPVTYVETHQSYEYQVDATDTNGDKLRFTLVEAAPGMLIDEDSGAITWDPVAGDYFIRLEVTDSQGESTQQAFNLIVNTLPNIVTYPVSEWMGGTFRSGYKVEDADGDTISCRFISAPKFEQYTQFLMGTKTCSINYANAPAVGEYDFQVEISDTRGGSIVHDYHLRVVPNHVPEIRNNNQVIEGFNDQAFKFELDAYDVADHEMTWTVAYYDVKLNGVTYPVENLTIHQDPMSIEWSPNHDDIGELVIGFDVHHTLGRSSRGYVTFKVNDRDFTLTSDPETHARVGVPYTYRIQLDDPDNQTINYSLNSAPQGMQVDAKGLVTWTPTEEGLKNVSVQASDGYYIHGQSFEIMVQPEDATLTSDLLVEKRVLEVAENLAVYVSYGNAIGQVTEKLSLNGQIIEIDASGNANLSLPDSGAHQLEYQVIDQLETVTKSITLYAIDPTDTTLPIADLLTPDQGQELYAPTSIMATVSDENLIHWKLLLRKGNETYDEIIAEGESQLTEESIAEIDTTLMLNGLYTVTLVAMDLGGNESVSQTSFSVKGDLKVGNISFSMRDIEIPLSGIPITLDRSYDSRRRNTDSDFGFGWQIGYQNMDIDETMEPTQGWYQFESRSKFDVGGGAVVSPSTCIAPLGEKKVSITLLDGTVEEFSVSAHALDGGIESISHPGCYFTAGRYYRLDFTAINDTDSQLSLDESVNNSFYLTQLDSGHLAADIIDGTYTPISRYTLTTKHGYIYRLDQAFGIESITDPNGHTLIFTESGIEHSTGKGIEFVRDENGRIRSIIDPAQNTVMEYEYDGMGNLRFVKDAAAIDQGEVGVEYTYTLDHNLIDIIDPLGRPVVKNIYDDEGRLIGQEDADGNVKTFNHNIDERTSIVTDLDGRSTIFNYDDEGNITQDIKVITDGSYDSDIITTFTHDDLGNETSKSIGDLDHTWLSTFEGDNQLTATDPEGNTVHYQNYNDKGQEGLIFDELGRQTVMEYDAAGNLTNIQMPQLVDIDTGQAINLSASNVINQKGQITKTTDLRGLVTTYTYYPDNHESAGQKYTESNPVMGTITYTYDANNNVKTETRQRTVAGELVDEMVTYEYDKQNRLLKTIYPDLTYIETVYDLAGNVDKERDRFGVWTDFEYDSYGRLKRTDYADGTFEKREYTAEGLLKNVTDVSGSVTSYEYDDAGRQWKVIYPDTTFTETRYTPQGWAKSERDARGNLTEYEYDKAGKRKKVLRHIGDETFTHTFEYYANGELKSETDSELHTTHYQINAFDQRIQTDFHNGTTTGQRYDAMGARTKLIDQNQRITQYGYDELGRLKSVQAQVEINGESVPATHYTYDEQGNKLSQTDAEGRTTSWTYDYYGRVLARTLPEGMSESFQYEDATRTIIHTDFKGQVTTTINDVMGRVSSIAYSDEKTETFTYWPNGQIKTVIVSEQGKDDLVTSYTYDNRDRLKTETQPNGVVLTYDYDANGNRTQVTTTRIVGDETQTTIVDYGYDALNRLETVTDTSGTTTYTYDKVGNQKTVTYPNQVVTEYTYNDVNQLTLLVTKNSEGTLLSSYSYELGNTGRRESITEQDGRYTDYIYDNLYRLTDEIIKPSIDAAEILYSANYQYDWVGNRTYSIVDDSTEVHTAYTYDDNDRLTQAGGTTYTYDNNGNTKTESVDSDLTSYTYDEKNKLVAVDKTVSGVTTNSSYTYNSDGIRTSQTVDGVETKFVVDSNRDYAQVLMELDSTDAVQVQYTYGDDLISQDRAGSVSYYHFDGLGSTRALSDSAGTVTDTYNYEAFGELLNSTGSTENSYLYTGEQWDEFLGKQYLRARYYDFNIGRFTQQDTWMGWDEDPTTLNKYIYANADAANGTDPSGNSTITGLMTGINGFARIAMSAMPTYSRTLGKVASGLVGAGLGYGLSEEMTAFIARNAPSVSDMLEEKRVNLESTIERDSRSGEVLYHYTSRASALIMYAERSAYVTPPFKGLGTGGNTRPAGFYATDIEPWNRNYTQSELSAKFYGGNRNKDVSWFLAIDGSTFTKVWGTSNEYVSFGSEEPGARVAFDPITVGPNLMLP